MRDKLPKRCKKFECGVINLDSEVGPGTHWVSYYKSDRNYCYFDSFGDLKPPQEFMKYIGDDCYIHFNYKRYQKFDTVIYSLTPLYFNLCLKFLFDLVYK